MSQKARQGKKIILDEVRSHQPFRVYFLTGLCDQNGWALHHSIWCPGKQQARCRQHVKHAG